MRHSTILLTIAVGLLLTLLCACTSREGDHPLLVAADSAIVAADYRAADSLLARFDAEAEAAAPDRPVAMRRQLLALTRRYVDDALTDADFSMADSLSRYYEGHAAATRHYVLSQLCMGDIYKSSGDNPSALHCFKEALDKANQTGDLLLVCWANQCLGDIYFNQYMLDECKSYYRNFFSIAEQRHDTLRMAYASHRMAYVSTIENKIDSTIFYYQQAIALAEHLVQKDNILPYSKACLCDIYIQIEEFDEAARIMPRDSMNCINWAYWHLGQNHADSAMSYFERGLSYASVSAKTEYLRILSKIEASKGNLLQSNKYYEQLVQAMDSCNYESQTEETRRVNAQFNVNSIKKERDTLARSQRRAMALSILLAVILTAAIPLLMFFHRSYRQRKDQEIIHERILRQEMEKKLRLSQQELEMLHQQESQKFEQFRTTRIYNLLTRRLPDSPYKLSAGDWDELAQSIDDICPHFTSRLLSLSRLSADELRICYLMKLNIPVRDIALLLNKTVSAISHARGRMWKKISGRNGSADEMDDFIRSF